MTKYDKMFRFVKIIFISAMMFFGCSLPRVNSLKCISMNNQECKVRPQIVNVNSEEPVLFPFSINDPYAKLCVPDVIKNLNVIAFETSETRYIKWHETCKCKYRLDGGVCNNKQRWNDDKCQCECKELIDQGVRNKGFIQNHSNCECECDKSCDVGEYLGYENCKCRKELVNELVEECT